MPYLRVNGTELCYEDHGGADAPFRAVVLLHGWGTSGRTWNAQLPSLVAGAFIDALIDHQAR